MAKRTNETYTIEITSPLVRPGIKIITYVSGKYLTQTLSALLEEIRIFNASEQVKDGQDKKIAGS